MGAPSAAHEADARRAADTPLLNDAFLTDVINATSAATMRAIVDTFWGAADDLITQLKSACARCDSDARKMAAHTLKGAAGNVGAARAAELARQLEHAPFPETPALLEALDAALVATRAALAARLAD